MATWKKVVVSGSSANLAALQVDNLTSGSVVIGGGTAGNLSVTAINGTGNILATTGATGVVMTGSFTGSFIGNGSQLTGISASALLNHLSQSTGIVPFDYNASSFQTVAVSGAAQLSNNIVTKWNSTDGKFVDSSLTDNGTVISGVSSIQLTGASSVLTGSFTGSFAGNGANVLGVVSSSYAVSSSQAANAVSASYALTASYAENANADLFFSGSTGVGTVDLASQVFSIVGTSNEIETSAAGTTLTIGLPNDVTIGNNLIVSNNLTVLGTASFQNTENLEVADRFILMASGSNTPGDGGLIIQQGTQNVGELFGFDSGATRWGFTGSFNGASSSFTPDAFVAAAIDGGVGNDPTAIAARYQAKGNIFIGNDQNIWIYS
jgi:hypothetical protein